MIVTDADILDDVRTAFASDAAARPSITLRGGDFVDGYQAPPPFDPSLDAVTDEYIERHAQGLVFLDPSSWRHYLPALVDVALRVRTRGSSAVDALIESLRPPDRDPPRLGSLTAQQENAMRRVLETLAFDEESVHQDAACRALEEWWTPGALFRHQQPLGYLYKHLQPAPADFGIPAVRNILSLAGCISQDFADYIQYWKHNGWWLFDDPAVMRRLAREHGIDLSMTTLCYYEAWEQEYDPGTRTWTDIAPVPSIPTDVRLPSSCDLLGYDIVTVTTDGVPGCSPLSCNRLAVGLPVNEHCLFDSFAQVHAAIRDGYVAGVEPGAMRIIAVFIPHTMNHPTNPTK